MASPPTSHPYYPIDLALSLAPDAAYLPNTLSAGELLLVFAIAVSALLLGTLLAARRSRPDLSTRDQALVLWFVMRSIHVLFEGYFVLHHAGLAGSGALPAQLWKEYARADSRYLVSDPLVLCMEACTVLTWGPLCLLTALLIVRSSPYRHAIQALVSTAHVYGCTLYLLTTYFEGVAYWRPEWVYFWVYFVGMNGVWIVVPGYCLYSSVVASARTFAALEERTMRDGRGKKDM